MSGSNLDISFFAGGGHMGELIRARDWSNTTLGPAESWPQSLRTALSICLNSNFPILIWWGRDLVMLYNDAYRPILGSLKHPHALGQPGRECWPEIWPIFGPMLEGVLDNGTATWSEDQLLLLDRNGYLEECYFTFSYSPIRTESGEVGGVFSAVTETTWRVLAERRNRVLGELAEQTAGATTSELVGTVSAKVLDRASADIPFALLYLLDNSDRFARRVGEAGFGDTAIPLPQIIDLETPTAATSPVARAAQTGTLTRIDNPTALWGALPTGTSNEPPTAALVLPIFGSSGATPVGLLVAGASTQHALDDEYVQFFLHVAERIATAISAARAYEEERRRAESLAEIDRAKTIFFSNVSHEFRTPLALMLGMAEDLQDDPEAVNPAAREQIEVIHRSSQRLLKLVNTLLDFSRIESGRIQACYEPTDLAALTTSLASMFRTATDRAHLPLLIDCPPLPEPVFVDRQMWEKILLNLLSNAFKYTLEGEITVRMQSHDNQAVLTVSDTGVGIPKDEMRNLFTRFYRIPGSRGRTHEGSGIGLSLAMELVRLHHGTIEADSIEGKGTTFRVKIPLGSSHLPAGRIGVKGTLTSTAISARTFVDEALTWIPNEPDSAEDTEDAPGIEHITPPEFGSPHTGPLAGARIVFADDNADLRRYVSGLLSRSGGEVIVATDGEVAIKAIRSFRPDLVLTDVMMPRLDGFGLLAAIRADENLKTLPVIMLSARAGEEARIEALNAGATDYIVKPFRSRELVARVESQINIGRIRDDASRREQALLAETESILSSISLGFMAVDRDWRITYINPAGERLAGIPRERLLGKTNWEAFPETIGKPVERELRRAMARRAHIQFEDHHEPAGLWLETDVFPLSDGGLAFYSRDISDRKRAEESLRESEERFRVMADGIAQIIWVTDEHGRMQFVNRAFTEFFGVTLETVQTDGWEPLVHPDDRDTYTAAYAEALRERKPFHAEARIRRHDGIWCWVESSGHPRFSADGEFQGIAGSSPDVTDRKIAEAAIRGSEERYRTLFEIQTVGLGIGDLEGRTLAMNPAGLRLHGFASESEMFSALREYTEVFELCDLEGRVLPPSEWPASRAIRGDFVRDFEVVLRNLANGHERVASYTVIPSRNAHGVVARLFYVMQDVTDHRRAEQVLIESEERFRTMADDIPLMVWVNHADGRVQFVNRAYTEFFGVPEEELRVRGWSPLVHPDDEGNLATAYQQAAENRQPFHGVARVRRHDGEWRWIEAFGQPRISPDGTFLGMAGTSIDITDRIQTEQDLRREQSLLQNITRTTDFMLVYLDPDFNFVWVNDAYAESCRMRPADMIGKNYFAFFPHAENEAIFRRARDSGETVIYKDRPFEFPDQPDRGTTWWDWSLSPIKDSSGLVLGLVFSLRETTPVVKAREALRESEERLYLALRGTQEGVWDWNFKDDSVWLSYQWFHMLGYEVGELEPSLDTFYSLLHPQDHTRVRDHIDRVLSGACEFNIEFRLRHKDGHYVDILSRAVAVRREPDGPITRLVGTNLDLTERKRIERDIEMISRFPRENPEPVMRIGTEGTLLYANDASAPLLAHWRIEVGETIPEPWRMAVLDLPANGTRLTHDIECGERVFSIRFVPIPGGDYVNLYGSDITEQRRAADALRHSEERLRSTLDNMLEGCAILSPDWTYLYVNHANARHAHMNRDDMIGRNMLEIIPGVQQSPFFAMYDRCMKTRTPQRIESEFFFADGSRSWYEALVQPVPEGIFVLTQEITDRKLYEQALRQSEARFRIALQNSPITVAALDRDLRYTWVYNTRHGFSPDAVIGKRPDELLPAEDIAELMAFFRYVLETGRPERREVTGYSGDLLLAYDITAEPFRDEHGNITGLNAVFIDIAEHKRIQRLLEENRRTISRQLAEIEAIYAQAPVGLCVIDRDLRFLHINARMAEINGLPIEAHLGAHVSEIVPGMTDLAGRIFQAILASGQPMLNVEIHGETPAQPGVPRDFIEHWLPLTDANGEIFAVNVVVEEVTERKRIEAELRHRTRELEIANEDLQRFGSYLAHDLRTPLRAIHGFAHILTEDYAVELDDEGIELIDRIAAASEHAAQIITDIQRLARLDTGEFLVEAIDLGEIAAELIEQIRLGEPDRAVEFIRHPDLVARADRRLITIALSNLLDNAWKYTGKTPHACIEFGVRYEADSPVFYIKDNGAGFNPAYIDKLFQPFQRLHAPGEFPGTGLGLAIVRKVITRHNGRVWAESEGSGATVSFTLNA